ncbi:MAG: hypothetical protein GEV03_00330 [Streptosporangiales bacterium]|nr:hypothetical protein [Streptosporangiales bacterium]
MIGLVVRRGRRRAGRDRGSVTAETAVVLPGLVLVLVASLWGVRAAAAQIACIDAARAGARAASRGEPLDAVRAEAARIGPAGARIDVRRDIQFVHVTVVTQVRPAGGILGGAAALPVRGEAAAIREDT